MHRKRRRGRAKTPQAHSLNSGGRYAVEIQAIGCIDASLFHGHVAGVVGACIRLFVVRQLACLRRTGFSAASAALASGISRLEYPADALRRVRVNSYRPFHTDLALVSHWYIA